MSSGGVRIRARDLALRVFLPAGAALALVAVLVGRARDVDYDLHLIAPVVARAGTTIPLRGHLYADLRAIEGPRLVAAEIVIELRSHDAGSRVVTHARTPLRASVASTFEGAITLPRDLLGSATLVATARAGEDRVVVERPLAITAEEVPRVPEPRALPALQALALGPLQVEPGAQAPDVLDVRVRGSACVPETPCEVLVRVGKPAASIRARTGASVVPGPTSVSASVETTGVVALDVTTHGPEAELTVEVVRAGIRVATRAVRLPVALGVPSLAPIGPVLRAPAHPAVVLVTQTPGACIVDAFSAGASSAGAWRRTRGLSDCTRSDAPPFESLDAGVWRVQVRDDPFSADSAAVRAFYVRLANESDADVLVALARAVGAEDPDEPFAAAVTREPARFTSALAPTASYLLAALEEGVHAQPAATSSLPVALDRLARERARVHRYALFALAATALALVGLVVRRGLRGGAEARRILTEAGTVHPPSRVGSFLRVAAVGASLLLLFAAIAVYLTLRIEGP